MGAKILTASTDAFIQAASTLISGGLVALPTETVYGLAADARNDNAIDRIYDVKGRPAHNPLILHILSPQDVHDYAEVPDMAQALINAFWPGPLTLVLPRKPSYVCPRAGAGLSTIAIRCPDAPWREAFLKVDFDSPIVMPSANLSGHVSPTCAAHVKSDLGDKIDLIIDAGNCEGGVESTIIKIEHDQAVLLRPGTLPAEAFAPFVKDLRLPGNNAAISAPGMLKSHYAPNAAVRLNALQREENEAYLGFGPSDVIADMSLSESGNLEEAARNLYSALRSLDTVPVIAVAPIPKTGIGAAINDRLRRAAAER